MAIDFHPDYPSTTEGERLAAKMDGLPIVRTQHHHAHIAACMAECGVPLGASPVLGVALDGLCVGNDGSIWGGEFLATTYAGFQRLAHFAPVPMLGGDAATREPWRNAYANIARTFGWETAAAEFAHLPFMEFMRDKQLPVLATMMQRGLNAPEASSAGRLFDAVAAAIGICCERASYEGQAAIELEALAAPSMESVEATFHPFDIESAANGSSQILGFAAMWRAVLTDLANGAPPALIAARFHKGLAAAAVAQLAAPGRSGTAYCGCADRRCISESAFAGGRGLYARRRRLARVGAAIHPSGRWRAGARPSGHRRRTT
ncbi:MAG: hypothetical protein P8Y67_06590 [Alphaproteobacteria bacterium]